MTDDEEASDQRQPHQQIKEHGSSELCQHHLQVAYRSRHERFERSGVFFLRERTHGDDRGCNPQNDPEVHGEVEYFRKRPICCLSIQIPDEAMEAEPDQKQNRRDHDVSSPRKEMCPQFPPHQGAKCVHQDASSSLSGRVTRTKISSRECRLLVSSLKGQPREQTTENTCKRRSTPSRATSEQRTYSPSAGARSKCSTSGICSQQSFRSCIGAAISATTWPRSLMSICRFSVVSAARIRP